MTQLNRFRGLKDLLIDATVRGASAVERVHLATAHRPFMVLKTIPPIAPAVAVVELVHDSMVAGTYGAVRGVTRVVDAVADAAIGSLEDRKDAQPGPISRAIRVAP